MQTKILLDEADMPTHPYNVVADMPNSPLGPDGQPAGPVALQDHEFDSVAVEEALSHVPKV